MNLNYKIISQVYAARLKDVLPDLISSQQTAFVANRFIAEITRLIAGFLDISNKLKINCYLVTIDIEKTFGLLDHDFIIAALEKFIDWIKIF